jgi:hypothetical protein
MEAYQRGLAGELDEVERLLGELGPDPVETAFRVALGALHYLSLPDHGSPPRREEVAALQGGPPEARRAGALACAQMELASLLAFDATSLDVWTELHARLTGAGDLALTEARAWARWLAGDALAAAAAAETLGRAAAAGASPPQVIRAQVLAALSALDRGAVDDAVAAARRASRMARTESLLAEEYLANIVLARVRRQSGRGHLALRILTQLGRVVPRTWRALLDWELVMAGRHPDAPVGPAADAITLRAAARKGDRQGLEAAARLLAARFERCAPFRAEVGVWIDALDPDREAPLADQASSRPAGWIGGDGGGTPLGIADPDEAGGAAAHVLARPGVAARRILRSGNALVVGCLQPVAERDRRVSAALAELALAGDAGLGGDELFARVYGFSYTTAKHEDALRTLLHRARTALGESGSIVRDGDRLRLVPAGPFVVADPRCVRPAEHRVLTLLASAGGALGARDIAAELRVPLRTVQLALKHLVDDGELRTERDGRNVAYVVEDTTFAEPSLTRLRPRGAH